MSAGGCLIVFLGFALQAQSAPQMMNNTLSRPTQLPLSGRSPQEGSVTVTQQTTQSTSNSSVNVIDSSVMVQGTYSGGVPAGKITPGVLQLTLANALAMGLRENLGALAQSAATQQAQGQRQAAKSELLPQLNTAIMEEFERINLRTQGVEVNSFPEAVKFNFYDARVRLNQSVLDFVKIRNLHGASEVVKANVQAAKNARDLIVLAVSGSYLQLVATQVRLDATAAQVVVSKAIYQQAADRLAAGLATRVDVTRSQVQLQTEQERLRSLKADLDTEKLRLARIIGLALGQSYAQTDSFPFTPMPPVTAEAALQQAMHDRSDLQAASANVRAAESIVKAAHAEHLPSLSINADFGAAGVTPTHESIGVYSVAGTLAIPIYEGGRIHADVEQATASLRQRKAEQEDVRGQIDQDVRQALIDIDAASDQVDVAKSNVGLAHETLEQSRDRFTAGITDTVELVQAQQAVVQADDDYVTAVFEHNLAKVSLARAMGNAEQNLPQLLRK